MLGDRDTTAKSKPWHSAMSVPIICSGPGFAREAVISEPTATIDLAVTFIDIVGGTIPDGMNATSLLPLKKKQKVQRHLDQTL